MVLAVSPNNAKLLINDQVRQVFYLYSTSGGIAATFGGMGSAAAWTPDSKTLYITDSASLGRRPHRHALRLQREHRLDHLALPGSVSTPACPTFHGAKSLAITIPSVGAYLSGNPTVAHTWCPTGTVGNYASMIFYPQGDF